MMKRTLILFSLLMISTTIYAIFIEPNWLEVTKLDIIGNVRKPIKIAHLTDLHLQKFGHLERRVLAAIDSESPDIIVVTGDTLDDEHSIEPARKFFEHLKAPLGTWAVLGNWENWNNLQNHNFFESIHIHLLKNEAAIVRDDFTLFGFDDATSGSPSRAIISEGENPRNYCVELFHSPQFLNEGGGKCPLALAGHTHGGQVRIPFFGPLWLPKGSGTYVAGWYQNSGTQLYVSRGIGTSILPIRLFARPEITFINIGRPHER